jgi:hypothetical protein
MRCRSQLDTKNECREIRSRHSSKALDYAALLRSAEDAAQDVSDTVVPPVPVVSVALVLAIAFVIAAHEALAKSLRVGVSVVVRPLRVIALPTLRVAGSGVYASLVALTKLNLINVIATIIPIAAIAAILIVTTVVITIVSIPIPVTVTIATVSVAIPVTTGLAITPIPITTILTIATIRVLSLRSVARGECNDEKQRECQ